MFLATEAFNCNIERLTLTALMTLIGFFLTGPLRSSETKECPTCHNSSPSRKAISLSRHFSSLTRKKNLSSGQTPTREEAMATACAPLLVCEAVNPFRRLPRKTRVTVPRASGDDQSPIGVPKDAFKDTNGSPVTPERKAAVALGNLFTMAATRVILDQFTGTRHRSPVYHKMVDFLAREPLRDGNEWLAKLMREPDNDLRTTALRIIETRRVFAETEFNWEICQRVAFEETEEDTLQMTKQFLMASLEGGLGQEIQSNPTSGSSW